MTLSLALIAFAMAAAPQPQGAGFEQLAGQASQAREQNRADDAVRLYLQALELQPSWKEGLWYLGTLLYQKDEFASARDVLRRFVAEEPGTGPGWTLLGMSEFQTHEYARSLTHLQQGLAAGIADRKEMTKSAYYFIAILLTRFERFNESMDLLMQLAREEDGSDPVMEAAGLAALQMPLLPAEIPSDRREMVRLAGGAVCALATVRDPEAGKLIEQLVAAYANEPGVHFLAGAFLLKQRPDEGMAEMLRELAISPDHAMARTRLADEYVKADKLDAALSLAEQAVALDPACAPAHLTLGEILIKTGDLQKGIRELETARSITPWVSRIHWDLSKAYVAAGRPADGARAAAELERLKSGEKKKLF
jgi:predicted Zn-dependent protease